MNIVYLFLFGLMVGILVNRLSGIKSGILGTTLMGVAGALSGGGIASLIFDIPIIGFNLIYLTIAILGLLLIIFINQLFPLEDEEQGYKLLKASDKRNKKRGFIYYSEVKLPKKKHKLSNFKQKKILS